MLFKAKSQKSAAKDKRKSTAGKANQNKDELVSVNTEMEHQALADARLFLATGDKTNVMKYKQAKCKFCGRNIATDFHKFSLALTLFRNF